jgi:enoyl-CoA hydratase/carnithine racemase
MNRPEPTPAAKVELPPEAALRHERLNEIHVVTLNRPETRNCLSEAMLKELRESIRALGSDDSVKAIVLASTGPAFSSGHDLKELTARRSDTDGGREYTRYIMEMCSDMMRGITRLPQPVVAAVEGVATAAGCQLVATCDLAIAGKNAKFCTPGVQIGLFCSTPMVALSRNVSRKHAMEMLLTGETILAEHALQIGLVNRVVAAGTARDEAVRFARKIASRSSAAIRFGKQAFYRQLEMNLEDAYRYANEVMVANMMAPDAEEGIAAFVEKREPKWEDR